MALVGTTDDLPVLEYGGKPILPEQQSYSVSTPDGTVVSDIPGGLPKTQLQYFNQPYEVSVTYQNLDGFKSAFMENFFARNQGQAFIATLLVSNTETEQFVVKYLGNSTHARTGFDGSMSINLVVEPAIDRCFQQVVLDWGSCVGSETCEVWNNTNEGVKNLPSSKLYQFTGGSEFVNTVGQSISTGDEISFYCTPGSLGSVCGSIAANGDGSFSGGYEFSVETIGSFLKVTATATLTDYIENILVGFSGFIHTLKTPLFTLPLNFTNSKGRLLNNTDPTSVSNFDTAITYDSATGQTVDYRINEDVKYGDVAPTIEEAIARNKESMVLNGDFRFGDNGDWGKVAGTSININNGIATITGGTSTARLRVGDPASFIDGETYDLSFTINSLGDSSSINFVWGADGNLNGGNVENFASPGDKEFQFVDATVANINLGFAGVGASGSYYEISNVGIRKSTNQPLTNDKSTLDGVSHNFDFSKWVYV